MKVASETDNLELQLLLDAVYLRYNYDFRNYARSSLKRRLQGAKAALGVETLSELQGKILRDEAAFGALLSSISVPTTAMFRDPEFFRAFRRSIVPSLRSYPHARVWVAGCSTGEEAYSLAIILKEEGLLEKVQIYATDINPRSLEQAERGTFPQGLLKHYAARHKETDAKTGLLEHCIPGAGDSLFLANNLRQRIVFSDHSLATDGIFAEVQVVTCRNVLIYFDRNLQQRALDLLTQSLCQGGFLGLGTVETALLRRGLQPLPAANKWFQRR